MTSRNACFYITKTGAGYAMPVFIFCKLIVAAVVAVTSELGPSEALLVLNLSVSKQVTHLDEELPVRGPESGTAAQAWSGGQKQTLVTVYDQVFIAIRVANVKRGTWIHEVSEQEV